MSTIVEDNVHKNGSEITNKSISIEQEFCNYWINERNISESSCRSYVSSIHKAEKFAREHNFSSTTLFTENTAEAEKTRKELTEDPRFQELNRLQSSRFSNAIAKLMVFHRTRGNTNTKEITTSLTENRSVSHIIPEEKKLQQKISALGANESNYHHKGKTLDQINELGEIEIFIISKLKGLSFWGNIDLSIDEYEHLKKIIALRIKTDSLKSIMKSYPASLTTFAVFMVRYKYNVNFWQLLSTELDTVISQSYQKDIGDIFLKSFIKNGFNFDPVKGEARKYVEPIIYQACLPPESCLDDLFFAIKTENRSHFDPQTFIEELINEKAYTIRKPLRSFLEFFQDTDAIEYILNIRDAMLAVEQRGTVETRYEIQYKEWSEEEKTKAKLHGKNKQEKHQIKPFLMFEEGRRGLCIVLPWTILPCEWIEEVLWTIQGSDGQTVYTTCRVFGEGGKRYIESITIPVYPAAEYKITMKDAENESDSDLDSWTINGITDFICFNSRGTAISSGYLPVPFCSFIIDKSVVIEECKNITWNDQAYPLQNENYRSISAIASNADALLRLKSSLRTVTLTAKPRINILLQGHTLFSLPEDSETKLYTEIPDLVLDLKELAFKQNLEIKIRSKRIQIQCNNDDEESIIKLNNYFDRDEQKFGTYSIRLYQAGRFLRQTEFCYVPNISTDYEYNLSWPKNNGKMPANLKFHFERNSEWELSFENCRVDRNQNEYEVSITENTGVLRGSLKSMRDDLILETRFELPFAPLNLEIIDPEDNEPEIVYNNPISISLNELSEQSKWISVSTFGEYRDKKYTIALSNADGLVQETPLRIAANGEGICSLAVFYDTLQNCVLPAKFEIRCQDYTEYGIPFMIISDKATLKDYPVYSPKYNAIAVYQDDGHREMEFTRFGKEQLTYLITENEWVDKQNISMHILRHDLPAGIYTLTDNKSMDIFQLEKDFSANLKQEIPSFLKKSEDSKSYAQYSIHSVLQDLLNTIFRQREVIDLDNNPHIGQILNHKVELEKQRELNDFEIDLLIALGFLVNSKISKSRKKIIINCMKAISEEVLSGIDRTRIIRSLTSMQCSQAVFDTCNSSYSLFLFDPDNRNMKQLAEDVEPYSIDLAYLMLIDTEAPLKDTLRLEKYRSLIGSDALKYMLGLAETKDFEARTAANRFLNDERTENIHVNLSPEISGEMQPLLEMLEEKKNKWIFNLEKKPDTGIYFDQIRFCDQYVNWYRLNHTYDGNIFTDVRDKMTKLVTSDTINDIQKSKSLIREKNNYRNIFDEYYASLHYRGADQLYVNLNINSLPRYFYLQGLTAFFSRILGDDDNSVFIRETGNRFLSKAYEISPRMVRRDILMASTFIYLKKKEAELCQ